MSVIDRSIAVITPSFARDFELCRELNESVLTFFGPPARHYVIVDSCDLKLFRPLANSRTVVVSVEDVLPRGYIKLRFSKKWWFSAPAMFPVKGWLIQQLVKLSAPYFAAERVLVNVDSDVRFVRPVDPTLFIRGDRTRMYRLAGGVKAGMLHVKWQRNLSGLLDVIPDQLPMNDYVGNAISWDRSVVLAARQRIEEVTGHAWHIALARARKVSEYVLYGLYVDKIAGPDAAGVWIDERPRCHTYWGPGPLPRSEVERFARSMGKDDVAFSIAGYTQTPPDITHAATKLALQVAAGA